MGKLKITPELIKKASKVIGNSSIKTNEGLSRKELRLLERARIVKKSPVFARRTYSDTNPQMQYIWEMVNKGKIK